MGTNHAGPHQGLARLSPMPDARREHHRSVKPAGSSRHRAAIVTAGGAYCAASITMVLINKVALSSFGFRAPTALLFFQCWVCVALVWLCKVVGLVQPSKLNHKIIRLWIPVNAVFVLMLWTSFMALKYLTSVPMLTVLKNLSNLFTITGDYMFYGRTYNWGVWGTLALMAVSAVLGALTDLEFSMRGYAWQVANCLFTSGYSLYLRGAMDRVAEVTDDHRPITETTMVYLNNLLSLPFLLALMLYNGEAFSVWHEPVLQSRAFLLTALLSALVSFAVSFSSLWFLGSCTPTTYSLVGSLNKVPITVISLCVFADRNTSNLQNLCSVAVGLAAGVVFVYAKSRDSQL